MAAFRSEVEVDTFVGLINETRKAISAEIELHTKLLENSQKKHEVILNRNLEELQELTRWDEAILEEVAKWEDYLERATGGLAALWREKSETLTMSRILELAAEEQTEISSLVPELEAERLEFQDILAKLKEQNDTNTMLLRRSLAIVNYSLDVILGRRAENSVYDDKGRRHDEGKKRFIDSQA